MFGINQGKQFLFGFLEFRAVDASDDLACSCVVAGFETGSSHVEFHKLLLRWVAGEFDELLPLLDGCIPVRTRNVEEALGVAKPIRQVAWV